MSHQKDSYFKNVLSFFLAKYGVSVAKNYEVTSANLLIDFLLFLPQSSPLRKYSPFRFFPLIIVGEFKSLMDFFNKHAFFTNVSKTTLYLAEQTLYHSKRKKKKREKPIPFKEVEVIPGNIGSVFIISGHKTLPRFIKESYGAVLSNPANGVYVLQTVLFSKVVIVLSEELELDEHNYFLGLFTQENFADFLKIAVRLEDIFMLTVAYMLFRDKLLEVREAMSILEKKGFTIKEAIESLGLRRVIDEVGLRRVIEEVGLRRVIEEVGLRRVIEEVGVKRVIDEIGGEAIFEFFLTNEGKKYLKEMDEAEKEKIRSTLKKILQNMEEK